jgi:hypothetical protein
VYRANSIKEIEEFFANLFEKIDAIAYDKNMANIKVLA